MWISDFHSSDFVHSRFFVLCGKINAMKMKKLFVFGILFAVFLFVGAEDAFAANWYVATNGNDSNSGSQSAPFRTIQRCANVAQAGDTCLVSAGTYNENISTVRSGTASGKIYIKGASGKPIASGFNINHAYTVVDGFMIDGAAASVSVNPGGNNCEILNNDFRNVENGIEMDRGNTTGPIGCLIRGNKFYGNTTVSVMVGLGGQGHIIEDNDFGPLVMHEDAFRPFGLKNRPPRVVPRRLWNRSTTIRFPSDDYGHILPRPRHRDRAAPERGGVPE